MVKQRCVLTNITYATPSAAAFPSSLHTETEMAMPPCQLQRFSSCTQTANVYVPVDMDSRREKKNVKVAQLLLLQLFVIHFES